MYCIISVSKVQLFGVINKTACTGCAEGCAGAPTDPKILTIKKLCDGLDITLGEFFSTPEFDALEQEIK